ncbi:hypothetical protein PybrP1_012672 [[Pythium] brassicae (nom. inval.)]|nr:hypothetical protein PybrP1_012672 [[Pythium] brassicae (nom. inval.)]
MASSAAAASPMARSTSSAVAAAVTVSVPAVAALASSSRDQASASKLNYRHFAGGALGGMTAAVLTSPLEVVKTRLQIKGASASLGSAQSLSTFAVMRSIRNTESVFGLWRGITPTLIGVIPARAIYFGAYSTFKEALKKRDLEGRVFNFLAAAGAGSISATLTCPIWVVKTRLQLMPAHPQLAAPRRNVLSLGFVNGSSRSMARPATAQFSSIRHLAIDMYRTEGPRAFFRGLSASYWGISESAIQFALYEEVKQYIEEPTPAKYFVAAGACKFVAAALTYPHEVVRTRMRDQRAPLGSKELKYKSMIQSLRTIFKEEGARGLYGGMPAHLMRVVPNAAIMFLVVEMVTAAPAE